MKTIYKYSLQVAETQLIDMPQDSKLLCVQIQSGIPCIWAIVDPEKPMRTRKIIMGGTGTHDPLQFELDQREAAYIGTVQVGRYVWHYFVKLD